jgi:hypothetical protein
LSRAGCSKGSSGKATGESKTEAWRFSPTHPELSEQLFSRVGYVEDLSDARTMLADLFSILLLDRG